MLIKIALPRIGGEFMIAYLKHLGAWSLAYQEGLCTMNLNKYATIFVFFAFNVRKYKLLPTHCRSN